MDQRRAHEWSALLDYASLMFSSISLDLIRLRNIISVSHRFGNCNFSFFRIWNSTKTFVSNFDQLDYCDSHLVFIYFWLRRVGNVFLPWRIIVTNFPAWRFSKTFAVKIWNFQISLPYYSVKTSSILNLFCIFIIYVSRRFY
jgi:hypothetical protein